MSRRTISGVNTSGRRIRRLIDSHVGAGRAAWRWDGRDDRGRAVPSGLYLVRVTVPGGHILTGRVTVVK